MLRMTIVVLLHLYNLNLMDEFIERINNLVMRNETFSFHIKINIPVAANIDSFAGLSVQQELPLEEQQNMYDHCAKLACYHPHLVTEGNCANLFALEQHIRKNVCLPPDHVQIIFSENRGVDVGGFFVMLDQLIKQNLHHDYIIKLHSKTHEQWRKRLLEMLDLDLKQYLPAYGAVYGCQRECHDGDPRERKVRRGMRLFMHTFKLPEKRTFFFSAGTMFIVSSAMTDFFKNCDTIALLNELQKDYTATSFALEHTYERFFGYLIEHLGLNAYYCNQFFGVAQL